MSKFTGFKKVINFDLARTYAKSNCKRCYGRGLLEYKDVGSTESRWEYCTCSIRNMHKYNK